MDTSNGNSKNHDNTQTFYSGYDPVSRAKLIRERLARELKIFEKHDFARDGPVPFNQETTKKPVSLDSLKVKIQETHETIKDTTFKGQHFTKLYRTLLGDCNKLLQQLDAIDHKEDSEVANQKAEQISRVQIIKQMLMGKVHSTGECCEDCELYNTVWQ